jgi:uncharacterized DUF497 family protein
VKKLPSVISFQWDEGNQNKNWKKHKVTHTEAEEVFFDPYKMIAKDRLHSGAEERNVIIGETKNKRVLFVVFTIRGTRIRVISARDYGHGKQSLYYLHRRKKYEKAA